MTIDYPADAASNEIESARTTPEGNEEPVQHPPVAPSARPIDSEIPDVLFTLILGSLQDLLRDVQHSLAFYDLVSLCRDSHYQVTTISLHILQTAGLMEGDRPSPTVRDVVLASVHGDGLAMTLHDPRGQQ